MRKTTLSLFSILFLLAIMAAQPGADRAPTEEVVIQIQVSPSTIQLVWKTQSEPRITVHTEINLGLVNTKLLVTLGDIEASAIFADARGDLVAKFDYKEVRALLDGKGGTDVEVTLTGTLDNDDTFTGSDWVRVKG